MIDHPSYTARDGGVCPGRGREALIGAAIRLPLRSAFLRRPPAGRKEGGPDFQASPKPSGSPLNIIYFFGRRGRGPAQAAGPGHLRLLGGRSDIPVISFDFNRFREPEEILYRVKLFMRPKATALDGMAHHPSAGKGLFWRSGNSIPPNLFY